MNELDSWASSKIDSLEYEKEMLENKIESLWETIRNLSIRLFELEKQNEE